MSLGLAIPAPGACVVLGAKTCGKAVERARDMCYNG